MRKKFIPNLDLELYRVQTYRNSFLRYFLKHTTFDLLTIIHRVFIAYIHFELYYRDK